MPDDEKKRVKPKQSREPVKDSPMDKFNEAMRKILSVPKKGIKKK